MATADETAIRNLQEKMWAAWNRRDAAGMAVLCVSDASLVGFDGSVVNGRADIEKSMGAIFKDHTPATSVGIVREVRMLGADAALVRSVAGMVPPGKSEIKADRNTI